jgi:hypothetical protein
LGLLRPMDVGFPLDGPKPHPTTSRCRINWQFC